MGQKTHDLFNVHGALSGSGAVAGRRLFAVRRGWDKSFPGGGLAHLRGDLAGELAIGGVARLDRDHMAGEWFSNEREIADNIENFVADEFLRVTERFVREHCVVTNHDGIFEAAAAD